MKNLLTVQQNNKVALQKSKSLMTITSKILSKDDWMQRLWNWADENHITGIPREANSLRNIIFIQLWDHQLIEVPPEIGYLHTLEFLNLEKNKLIELPEEIGNLNNLQGLGLFQNKISVLPNSICNLVGLTALYLSSNQLIELPNEITNLTELRDLKLNANHNLILTPDQKNWIHDLIEDGCSVDMDDDLFDRKTVYDIAKGT